MVAGRDPWAVQRLLVNAEPTNLRLRRQQVHPAPPQPSKVNARDISKYFDSPNKENKIPQHGVNGFQQKLYHQQEEETKEGVEEGEKKPEGGKEGDMGSNLSRHNGKGLTGRRTQSSGNLCDPKGKLNSVGKILVPCSGGQRER